MEFCIHIDIDMMYPMRLPNDIWDWLRFCRGSNSEKSETITKWHLSSVEALPSSKFWKSENGPISWTEWNIVMQFCIHIGILTRCSPWDCQMTFGIGRGFAEVQILKKSENYLLNRLEYFYKILQTIWCWKDLGKRVDSRPWVNSA